MNEIDIFFNRFGAPEIRLLDNGRFVSFSGKSLGFWDNGSIYDYRGNHLGWLENGVIRDHYGCIVWFGNNPTDFPLPFLPFKQFVPFRHFVEFEPFRPFKSFPPFRPFKNYSWSNFDIYSFFNLRHE
jgi:hypothetical protein